MSAIEEYSKIYGSFVNFFPILMSGAVVAVPFVILWYINKSLFHSWVSRSVDKSKNYAIVILGESINVIIASIAALTVLGTMGVDISALVAGFGLTGVAVGVGLKDVAANGLAGIIIIFFKPFKIGSYIIVSGVEGEVIEIDLRYTTLESKEEIHLVPNSVLLSEKISIKKTVVVKSAAKKLLKNSKE